MVLGLVSSEAHVLPPHFFGPPKMVTSSVCMQVPATKVKAYLLTEGHQRFIIRVSAGLGYGSYCQQGAGKMHGEHANGVDRRLLTP